MIQDDQKYKNLMELYEYWQDTPQAGHTYAVIQGANNQNRGCIIVVAHNQHRKYLQGLKGDQALREYVRIVTIDEVKAGKIKAISVPLVMDHLAIMQLLQELTILANEKIAIARAEVYEALLGNGMIKTEHTKSVYQRAKEIRKESV